MNVRVRAYISGRVQGVFFRSSVADLAAQVGVTGWVRNLSDGRVEALLEGQRETVENVVEYCKRGPPGAHVQGLDLKWEDWQGEFRDFKIIY